MATTIYEIANKAGVSPKTAARILSGETKRSKGREAVLAWAERLGYVRNASAANLRTGRSQLIGLIVPFIDNPYYTRIIQEFHDALAQVGFKALVSCSFGQTGDIVSSLKVYQAHSVDGILFNGSEGELTTEITTMLSQFQESGKPVILVGRYVDALQVDQVNLDNQKGIAQAVQHLVDRGHRGLAFLGGSRHNRTMQARSEGFVTTLRELGLEVRDDWMSFGETTLADAQGRAGALLGQKGNRPEAIVCGNDLLAMAALKACRRHRLSVPGEVAITGFDDIEQASLCEPELTTVRQPIPRIARECVDQLLRRLNGEGAGEPRRLLYQPELVIRESS